MLTYWSCFVTSSARTFVRARACVGQCVSASVFLRMRTYVSLCVVVNEIDVVVVIIGVIIIVLVVCSDGI